MAESNDAKLVATTVANVGVVAPSTASPGKSKIAFLAGALAAALVVSGGFYWWQNSRKQAEEASEKTVEQRLKKQLETRRKNAPPVFIQMEEFLVNVPGAGGEHYLQTKLVLRTADAGTEARIKDFLPMVRDRVIAVLSSRSMSELATIEGKDAMARDIALVINAIIEPQLTAIYIIQQDPQTADVRKLERLGAIPKQTAGGGTYSQAAREAAAQFWKVTEMDLPVQAVLFNSLVMQ